MAPQRDRRQLAHAAFDQTSKSEVLQEVRSLQKEKQQAECDGGNRKYAHIRQHVVPGTDKAEGSEAEDGRQDEDW